MNTVPISDFDDVILFELQKKVQQGKHPSITFGEMWSAAANAAPNFMAPVDPTMRRNQFVARMMEAVSILNKCEFISITTNYGDKIDSVRLTEAGINHVSKIVYTHQQRCTNLG